MILDPENADIYYESGHEGGAIVKRNTPDDVLRDYVAIEERYFKQYHSHIINWKDSDEEIKRRIGFDESKWVIPKSAFEEY